MGNEQLEYLEDFSVEAKALRELVVGSLEQSLSALQIKPPLSLAVHYAVLPAGKCIRPLFALCLCKDLGGDEKALAQAAISLEFIHASSLIHDDLPALDNDDMRRGRASCHKKFGEATAILAGDFLVSHAFNNLIKVPFSAEISLAFVDSLAKAFSDLCAGQQLDLLPHDDNLEQVHSLKTGALFRAAACFGALGAGRKDLVDRVGELGLFVGKYFQAADDYIDLYGSDELRGRSGSSDTRNQKKTYFSGKNKEKVISSLEATKGKITALVQEIAEKSGSEMLGTTYILEQVFARMG